MSVNEKKGNGKNGDFNSRKQKLGVNSSRKIEVKEKKIYSSVAEKI